MTCHGKRHFGLSHMTMQDAVDAPPSLPKSLEDLDGLEFQEDEADDGPRWVCWLVGFVTSALCLLVIGAAILCARAILAW